MPVVLICNDPCTYVSHSLQRYPVEAQLAYGKTRGCFQKPDEDIPPKDDISWPEITPIEFDNTRVTNRDAMKNQSTLIHPDVSTSTRYVLGTRYVRLSSIKQEKISVNYSQGCKCERAEHPTRRCPVDIMIHRLPSKGT